jgi:hypothetical protein
MDEETPQRDVTVGTEVMPIESTSPSVPAQMTDGPAMPRLVRRIAPWAMAVIALILVSMLALLFADTHSTNAAVRPTPTVTPAPTATLAPTVTPAPIDGFQFYRDPTNHFVIQYPLNWEVSSDNTSQGIEFCDDCTNPGYIVQVNTPSNLGDVGPPPNQSSAADWVTYALNGLASHLQSGTLTVQGPQQPIVIGGVVWQSGGAVVSDSTGGARFRVQVYATVHEGKPYILVLSTTEDRFTAGTIQFFGPMLQSFEFVQQTP